MPDRHASTPRKGIEAQRVKSPIPIWEIDVLIGDEEQNGKHKKEEKWGNSRSHTVSLLNPPTPRPIYILFIIREPTPTTAGSSHTIAKKGEKERTLDTISVFIRKLTYLSTILPRSPLCSSVSLPLFICFIAFFDISLLMLFVCIHQRFPTSPHCENETTSWAIYSRSNMPSFTTRSLSCTTSPTTTNSFHHPQELSRLRERGKLS